MPKKEIKNKPKCIVILGPTASGKTKLGVKLAYDFNGEIVSADSRQVYVGLDIGTGKDLPDYKYRNKNIPYHLIDVASPSKIFNVSRYQKLAYKAINDIVKRGKLPIIVGGSGLYLQAVVDNYKLPTYKSNKKDREKLEALGADKLYKRIEKENPNFAKRINESDKKNARRLSRYLELIKNKEDILSKNESLFDFLILGVDIDDSKMKEKINKRLEERIESQEMIEEVQNLRKSGLSFKKLISFGLEYKFVSNFLQGKIDRVEMKNKLATAIYRFAKRQKTWFKRWEKQGREINWISSYNEAEKKVKKFIKKPQ